MNSPFCRWVVRAGLGGVPWGMLTLARRSDVGAGPQNTARLRDAIGIWRGKAGLASPAVREILRENLLRWKWRVARLAAIAAELG